MSAPIETLYDVLGVAPDANGTAIGQAYNRLTAEFRKDTTAPDAKREALIRTAYETLSDHGRRAEYDASLVARKSERAALGAKRIIPIAIAGAVVLAAAIYFIARKPAAPPTPVRTAQEVLGDISRSIGRVQSIDMSGAVTQVGLAFAIGGGVMATTCHGLGANSQIVVTVAPRSIASRLTIADEELGVCKLAVDGTGSWPLAIASVEPRAGDRVFAPGMNAAGELAIAEGSVKSIVVEHRRRLIEVAMPAAIANGAPLLDASGKVVGVVTLAHDYGEGRNLALPAALVNQAQSRGKSP